MHIELPDGTTWIPTASWLRSVCAGAARHIRCATPAIARVSAPLTERCQARGLPRRPPRHRLIVEPGLDDIAGAPNPPTFRRTPDDDRHRGRLRQPPRRASRRHRAAVRVLTVRTHRGRRGRRTAVAIPGRSITGHQLAAICHAAHTAADGHSGPELSAVSHAVLEGYRSSVMCTAAAGRPPG